MGAEEVAASGRKSAKEDVVGGRPQPCSGPKALAWGKLPQNAEPEGKDDLKGRVSGEL